MGETPVMRQVQGLGVVEQAQDCIHIRHLGGHRQGDRGHRPHALAKSRLPDEDAGQRVRDRSIDASRRNDK
jgi:hypothetical protein